MDNFSNKIKIQSGKGFIPVLILVAGALIIGIILATQVGKTSSPAQPLNLSGGEVPDTTPMASPAGDIALMLDPAMVNATVNQTFKVDVNIDTKTDTVSAIDLHVSYDPAALEAVSIVNGTYLPVVLAPGKVSNGKATMAIGVKPTEPKKGTGTVATITFKALKSGSTMVMFDNATQVAAIGKTTNTLGSTAGTTVTVK